MSLSIGDLLCIVKPRLVRMAYYNVTIRLPLYEGNTQHGDKLQVNGRICFCT